MENTKKMNNIIKQYEKEQIEKLVSKKRIPTFRAGDTIKVTLKIIEGERSRLQAFEGVCIGRKNNGLMSNFTIRKLSHGEGVEKIFPLFSSLIDKIEVVRKGQVNQAKLYYLRNRKGKSARIVDSDRGEEEDQYAFIEPTKQTNEASVSEESNIDHKESKNKKIEDKKEALSETTNVKESVTKNSSGSAEEVVSKESQTSSAATKNAENETTKK